jgi:hypothetical protein
MDNPKKKKADGKRISQQPHEQAYQKKKVANRNENESRNGRASTNERNEGRGRKK